MTKSFYAIVLEDILSLYRVVQMYTAQMYI